MFTDHDSEVARYCRLVFELLLNIDLELAIVIGFEILRSARSGRHAVGPLQRQEAALRVMIMMMMIIIIIIITSFIIILIIMIIIISSEGTLRRPPRPPRPEGDVCGCVCIYIYIYIYI